MQGYWSKQHLLSLLHLQFSLWADLCCEYILAQSLSIKHTYPSAVSLFSFACEIAALPFLTSLKASLLSFPGGSDVNNLPAMQESWVQSLGRKDSLEKEMATHSSTLAWKIPWTEEPGRLQSMESQRVGHNWTTSLSYFPLEPSSIRLLSLPVHQNSFCQGHHWPHTARSSDQTTSSVLLSRNPAYIVFLPFFPSWNTLLTFRTMFSFDSPPCSSGTSIHFFAGFSSYCQAPNSHRSRALFSDFSYLLILTALGIPSYKITVYMLMITKCTSLVSNFPLNSQLHTKFPTQ